MFFVPGRVMNFRNDGFHVTVGPVVTIIEARGVEAMAEVPKMRQQPNRAGRAVARPLFNQISHFLIQWKPRIPKMVPATKPGDVEPFKGPAGVGIKKVRQFIQIEEHQKKAVAELVSDRAKAAMPHISLIDVAVHDQSASPKCLQTASALFTPSS
jgi:hypothetical protein